MTILENLQNALVALAEKDIPTGKNATAPAKTSEGQLTETHKRNTI